MSEVTENKEKPWTIQDYVEAWPIFMLMGLLLFILVACVRINLATTILTTTGTVSEIRIVTETQATQQSHPIAGAVVGSLLGGTTGAVIGLASQQPVTTENVTSIADCIVTVGLASGPVLLRAHGGFGYLNLRTCALLRKGDRVVVQQTVRWGELVSNSFVKFANE